MRLAIMQPYFLPYLGYFALMKHTQQFILLDTVQYIRHGWIDRNRILKPDEGWQYIKVPLKKHSREICIKDVQIDNDQRWKVKILAQIQHYKKNAPHFEAISKLLNRIFAEDYDSIVRLNLTGLKIICDYLKIDLHIDIFSAMNLKIEKPGAPDEWALNICKAIPGVSEYWNPPGGIEFFDKGKYLASSIELRFLEMNLPPYNQRREVFTAGLSIIDVLMFNEPDSVNLMLDNYVLL